MLKIILSRLRKFYLIIYSYIYEFCDRKRKKLNLALTKLKNLNLKSPEIKKNIDNLTDRKNQLEIEKQKLEQKYKSLLNEHEDLTKKLNEFQNLQGVEKKTKGIF